MAIFSSRSRLIQAMFFAHIIANTKASELIRAIQKMLKVGRGVPGGNIERSHRFLCIFITFYSTLLSTILKLYFLMGNPPFGHNKPNHGLLPIVG